MKIQILELPTEHTGEYMHTPYALIVSEAPSGKLKAIAEELAKDEGDHEPKWVYVTSEKVTL